MTGEVVVEDLQLHIEALNISDVDVDKILSRVGVLAAERDKARRIAVSLEADLARILDAWDDPFLGDEWKDDEWREGVEAAIAAARKWVGTEATP